MMTEKQEEMMIRLFSYYREAELRGAEFLLRLIKLMRDDGEAQAKLTRHLADETRHAWLWTKRIAHMGGTPVNIDKGYQTRMGREIIPRTLVDLLALTLVVEESSQRRYLAHARRKGVDKETLAVLQQVTRDERWHISWVRAKAEELAALNGEKERLDSALERYHEVDLKVMAELGAMEREAFGFSFSDSS